MEFERIGAELISVGKRKRSTSRERLDALKGSMAKIGLIQPITVFSPTDEECYLVSGFHRLTAAKELGWPDIDCILVEADELDRELIEIDENLCRAELTALEEAEHLARRKEIFEAKAEAINSGKNVPTIRGPGMPKGFDADTAEMTGMTKRGVNMKRTRAEKIVPEVKEKLSKPGSNAALAKAADSGTDLDTLKKLEPEEQKQATARVKMRRANFSPDGWLGGTSLCWDTARETVQKACGK